MKVLKRKSVEIIEKGDEIVKKGEIKGKEKIVE